MTRDRRVFLIAVAGGSGSGKSTVVDALLARLGPEQGIVVHEDAYYWPMSHYGEARTDTERAELAARVDYDDPGAKDVGRLVSDLAAVKRGEAVDIPVYDYARHDRSDTQRRIAPRPVVIFEGIHALSLPELRPLVDLAIYVDTPDDLRLARRLRRDVVERGRDVEGVLNQYLASVRPAHYRHTYPAKFSADLVIADEGLPAYGDIVPSEAAIERMLAPILERLHRAGLTLSRTAP